MIQYFKIQKLADAQLRAVAGGAGFSFLGFDLVIGGADPGARACPGLPEFAGATPPAGTAMA